MLIRNRLWHKIAIIIGMFIILYNPPLLPFNTMHVVGIISLGVLVVFYPKSFQNVVRRGDAATKVAYLVLGIIVMLMYNIMIGIANNSLTAGNIAESVYYLLDVIPFSILLTTYCNRRNYQANDYFDLLLLTGYIQAILAVASFFIEPLKIWFNRRLAMYGYASIDILVQHRNYGFAGTLTFATPVIQSILSLIAIYQGITKSKKYFFGAILLFFSAVINARTSLIVLGVGIIFLFIRSQLSLKKKVSMLGCFIIFCLFASLFFPVLLEYAPATFRWIEDGIKEIEMLLGGNTENGTFSILLDPEWYKVPGGVQFVFGTGHTVITGYDGYNSDVGYINDIWFGGIFYILIKYVFIYALLVYIAKKGKEDLFRYIGILFMVLLPILNIKGQAFAMSGFINMIFILFFICISLHVNGCVQETQRLDRFLVIRNAGY